MSPPAPPIDRERFAQAVADAVGALAGTEGGCAVLLVRLDRDALDDALGRGHGDRIIAMATERLEVAAGAGATVTRLRGSDFGVVTAVAGIPAALAAAERLRVALLRPFAVAGLTLEVGVSIGVACAPEHGEDRAELLRHGDLALGAAVGQGGGVGVYDRGADRRTPERLELAAEMLQAMDRGEIAPYFQPIVDVTTGAVVGAEALARWRHPTRGLLPAGEWLELAGQIGLLAPLTDAMLDHALAELSRWRAAGLDLHVAVNLAKTSFLGAGLLDQVTALLDRWDLPPDRLRLEVTEPMITTSRERAGIVLARLRAMGVGLSLDDFGTGDSSLTQLTKLPVDEVKLDRPTVEALLDDHGTRALVRSVIALAHDLGLRVVAEGVSEPGMLEELSALGCDWAQGFLFAPALSADDLMAWLAQSGRPQPRLATQISS